MIITLTLGFQGMVFQEWFYMYGVWSYANHSVQFAVN